MFGDRLPFQYSSQVTLDTAAIGGTDMIVESWADGAQIPVQWRILGQLWDMYILLEDNDFFYIVDQHALAERIAYERLKNMQQTSMSMMTLLQPVSVSLSPGFLVGDYEATLTTLGFDVAALSDSSLVIYGVPQFFADYQQDLEHVVHVIMTLDHPTYDLIADTLYAQKACKASIKA
jgi:DNA mismatch repair protein MutL